MRSRPIVPHVPPALSPEREQLIAERQRIGPRAMRALFGPRGRLVPQEQ